MNDIPGMNEETKGKFILVMEMILEHGWGQVNIVIGDHAVRNLMPSFSMKATDDLPPIMVYRQERRLKHGD